MADVHVTLLGAFGLTASDGTPIRIEARKARALLAILLTHRKPVPRERLAGLLWSRGESRQALASLSQALYTLRGALAASAPDLIEAGTETVSVDLSAVDVDVLTLEQAAAQQEWLTCLEHYHGPFLDDLAIETEEAFSDWRTSEQARLEEIAARAGSALMAEWEADPAAADDTVLDRVLTIEPYSEAAIRVRMLKLTQEGRATAALDLAERFSDRLSDDLGIEPSPEFFRLETAIRNGELRGVPRPLPADDATTAPRRRWPVFAATAALVAAALVLWVEMARDPMPEPGAMRLLVRPFEAGPGIEPRVAVGFGDDLATELVRRATLEILSRESGRLIPEGEELANGASHLMGGRLRTEGGEIVLNLWITDLSSGREVWADRIVGSSNDLRGFRNDVVAHVANRVDLEVAEPVDASPAALPAEAVDSYLRATSLLHAGTAEANAEAIEALEVLRTEFPDARGTAAALAVAYERVAFGSDDHAREAGLHWLEGYLNLKAILAMAGDGDADVLAARARLALRRQDYAAAEALSGRALRADQAHVGALEVLAETLALVGRTTEASEMATRVVTLSPALPERGYMALALARFAEGDMSSAGEAVQAALDFSRDPQIELLALAAAIEGTRAGPEDTAPGTAFAALVEAVESRPFGAWRLGNVDYQNPRAATWRRPTAEDAASLIRYSDPDVDARFRAALLRADPMAVVEDGTAPTSPLEGPQIEALLFGAEIVGRTSWLVQQPWTQVRTEDGELFQDSPLGPLPAAKEGTSRVFENRLCDGWDWQGTSLESCQLVFQVDPDTFALQGETGWYEFRMPALER